MIEIAGLQKSYGTRRIIDGISLSVPKGTVCGVLGPSGSGKSTLLRCVNFLSPTRGARFASTESSWAMPSMAAEVACAGHVARSRACVPSAAWCSSNSTYSRT